MSAPRGVITVTGLLKLPDRSQDRIPEEFTTQNSKTNESAMVGMSLPEASQPTVIYAPNPNQRIEDNTSSASHPLLDVSAGMALTQLDLTDTTPITPGRTCPQRQAAIKALHTLSSAYEPLIIHAARSERRSPASIAGTNAGNTSDVLEERSSMLVIDDMLPRMDDSEGDSDGYEATGSRKGKRSKAGIKRKRGCADPFRGSVRRQRGKKKGEKLDRDDLKLIARAAQGLMSGEDRKRIMKKKKGESEGMLAGLKRIQAEKLVRFVEEHVDWDLAAVRLSEGRGELEYNGDKIAQAQPPSRSQEVSHKAAFGDMWPVASYPEVSTAEGLREHWRDVLSDRIVNMYLD
ncbi:hypothetical protein MMC16_001186 [Acarospora aff. strigata]|nr:hypothetical protein [Acarospora aff. strigata]